MHAGERIAACLFPLTAADPEYLWQSKIKKPNMSNLKRNILSVYSVNIVNGLLGIVFVPLSLKLLGTNGYGLFSIYGVLATFITLIDLGVGKNLLRLLAADTAEDVRRRHLQNAFGIYLALFGLLLLSLPVLLVVVPAYLFPVSPENVTALRWILFFSVIEYALIIPIYLIQNVCLADEKVDRYSRFTLVSGLVRYALMFGGIFVFKAPEIVVGMVVGRRLLDFLIAQRMMGKIPGEAWRPVLSVRQFKAIVGHSSALSIAQTFQSTVIAIGSVLVNRSFGLEGLGKYRAAFDLASKVWFFSNGAGIAVFPKFVKELSSGGDKQRFFSIMYRVMNASWAGFILLSIAGTLVTPLLFNLMHIHDKGIAELFVILLLGICMNAHANLSYELQQATGKYKLIPCISALSLVLIVACFYMLQHGFGIHAIGWSWVISQAAYAMVSDAFTMSILRVRETKNAEMLLFKLAALLASLTMISIYSDVLPSAFTFVPAAWAPIIFLFLIKPLVFKKIKK